MVERQLCKLDVRGSSPLTSTPAHMGSQLFSLSNKEYTENAGRRQIDIRVAKLYRYQSQDWYSNNFVGNNNFQM